MRVRRRERIGMIGGALGLAGIVLFIVAAVVALLAAGSGLAIGPVLSDPVILPALRFTLTQASISTLLAVVLAIPVARALARRPAFPGRIWIVRLMAVPMGLPVLIGALGLIGIWGRSGLANDLLLVFGADAPVSIYGLGGVLLAHVFFNLPLAVRLLLAGLERVPAQYWLISAELGMRSGAVFRFIEWPVILRLLPGVAGLIFMLCATSFTLVLVLGGGPAATTLEVAIYQALRFDFDPGRAVILALLQILVTGFVLAVLSLLPPAGDFGPASGRAPRRFDGKARVSILADGLAITLGVAFVGLPLGSILIAGLGADLGRLLSERAFWSALTTSLAIAGFAAALSLTLSLALIRGMAAAESRTAGVARRGFAGILASAGSLVMLVPAIVLATGWFLILRPYGEVARFAPAVVVCINALMALPFVMRVLRPAIEDHHRVNGRLADSLGLRGLARLRHVDLPVLGRPLAMALSFAMALSLGDLGAVALFGAENLTTLPFLVYSRLGSYRTADADGLALLLGLICLALTMFGTAGAKSGKEA